MKIDVFLSEQEPEDRLAGSPIIIIADTSYITVDNFGKTLHIETVGDALVKRVVDNWAKYPTDFLKLDRDDTK
jgi:hypothetical protein